MKALSILLLLLVTQFSWAQDKGSASGHATANQFIGIWEAFQEGDPPDKARREEPSKLVILQDGDNRIVVFVATRYADRQIRFRYGIAHLDKGGLVFMDQKGFPVRITVGRNTEYDHFLGVRPDLAGAESEIGSFRRVDFR